MKPNDILREFVKYKTQLAPFHEQMRKNESLFKQVNGSPFLQNAMWTKHADAMDNFPSATFLPTHENARESASLLCKVFPIMLEQMDFEQTYSDFWWAKLKHGTACMGTFFDGEQVVIKNIDMKRLYFNTQVNGMQDTPISPIESAACGSTATRAGWTVFPATWIWTRRLKITPPL